MLTTQLTEEGQRQILSAHKNWVCNTALKTKNMACLATVYLKETCTNNQIQLLVLRRQKFKHVTSYNIITKTHQNETTRMCLTIILKTGNKIPNFNASVCMMVMLLPLWFGTTNWYAMLEWLWYDMLKWAHLKSLQKVEMCLSSFITVNNAKFL